MDSKKRLTTSEVLLLELFLFFSENNNFIYLFKSIFLCEPQALQHPWLKKGLGRAPSVKALHPSYRSQLYRTASQKVKKESINQTVDAAIGIRRKGTTKKEQEENAERRKKAIEEKKNQPDIDDDIEIEGPSGIGATLRAKLGLKPKVKDDKAKDDKKDKEKRKSKAKEGGA